MAAFRTLDDLDPDVGGNAALVRVDFNVPMENGRVTDDTRLRAAVPTIKELQKKNAAIVLLAHFGRPKGKVMPEMSLKPLLAPLSELLGTDVKFGDDLDHPYLVAENLKPGEVLLLENLRFKPGEEANDPKFAMVLRHCGDYYINDAFSAAHRAHASTEGLAHLLPAYAGRAMQKEIEALEAALGNPKHPVVAVIGGAKVSSKIDILVHLVTKVDALVIGGGMANTFLLAKGVAIGKSLAEPDLTDTAKKIMAEAAKANSTIVLPVDAVVAREFKEGATPTIVPIDKVPADQMILDVGPQSVAVVNQWIDKAATLVWNGPLGAFEVSPFDKATVAAARHAAERTKAGKLLSVAGGGETVAALHHAGAADGFSFISTAGGAFLEWLEGKPLPGVEVLRRKG